jgi:hypothetical protein
VSRRYKRVPGSLKDAAGAMQLFFVTTLIAAILVILPIIDSGMRALENTAAPARMTVIMKNQSSPTREELGQKAGDPAQADVPENARDFGSPRTEQWI